MQQNMDGDRKYSSQLLPLIVAAFAGATLAIACERPDARMQAAQELGQDAAARARNPAPAQPEVVAQAAPAAVARPLPGDAINDTLISARIQDSLLADPALAGADISVNTDRGVVSLVGSVKSHEQTGVASAHAQRQEGVMRVDNHLSLDPQ
ncbi:MAG TPA: BON domain-containing protein [Usitatibacter sp.]|nr:BON domain-containing protein [Usitatibacter sp.]